jgi:hypothetical protein
MPNGLVDSEPDQAILINLDEWYKTHPQSGKSGIISEIVFTSPRPVVMIKTAGKGRVAASHYHTVADEILLIVGGVAEKGCLMVNGFLSKLAIYMLIQGVLYTTRGIRMRT